MTCPLAAAQAGPVASPCIKVCRIDPVTGWCEGCHRTLDEIARWGEASDAERRRILAFVARRRQAPGPWAGMLRGDCD